MTDERPVKGRLDPAKLQYVSGPRSLATDDEVDGLERELGTKMPPGYRGFVTTVGEGLLGLTFSVFAPWNVAGNRATGVAQLEPWRWESGETGSTPDNAADAIWVIAGHSVGHVYFYPSDPGRLVHFPIRGGPILAFDGHMYDFFEWALTGGIVRSPRRHQFEAGTSRGSIDEKPAEPLPRPSWEPKLASPPPLYGEPARVLATYFAELCEVERWAAEALGGRSPSDPRASNEDALVAEIVDFTDHVQARYLTLGLQQSIGSGTVTISSSSPEHAPERLSVISETRISPTRVAIETSEVASVAYRRRYVMDRGTDGWRIGAIRGLGVIPEG